LIIFASYLFSGISNDGGRVVMVRVEKEACLPCPANRRGDRKREKI
jgi:hypothetical protein